MNAKQAKRLRARAKRLTQHIPDVGYVVGRTTKLGECTKGAYRALKSGRYSLSVEE